MAVIVDDDNIRIEKLQLGPFGTNAYIIVCQKTQNSLVVDAPAEAGKNSNLECANDRNKSPASHARCGGSYNTVLVIWISVL